jgi:hypothetical protein
MLNVLMCEVKWGVRGEDLIRRSGILPAQGPHKPRPKCTYLILNFNSGYLRSFELEPDPDPRVFLTANPVKAEINL